MGLQEELATGKLAEEFLNYTAEKLYFGELLERIKLEYAQAILSLDSGQKDAFSDYRSKMEAIGDILNAVRGDVYLGGEAFKELEGKPEIMKGIL